jgi:hypothetical protein
MTSRAHWKSPPLYIGGSDAKPNRDFFRADAEYRDLEPRGRGNLQSYPLKKRANPGRDD